MGYRSLSHLSNCMGSNRELCMAMISMLAGKSSIVDNNDADDDTINDESGKRG